MEAFANAGQKEGIEIWRIEKMKPIPYPVKDYGKFYIGDSYIVLKTSKSLRDWDIFFWLGTETTKDEAGAAAIYSVHLDDHLGGGPVQHREVQEHESQLFLSLFPSGVRYLPGGIESGFKKVEHTKEVRFFHVKGKRNVRVKQVEPHISSMNKGDCFILDNAGDIMVYFGPQSRQAEKIKAVQAANAIKGQDHNGRATVDIIEEGSPQKDFDKFFAILKGGSKDEVPDEKDGGADDDFEKTQDKVVTLYQVSDATGSLQVTKVGEKPLEQSSLKTEDCFILDTGTGLYVWVGKECTAQEKRESMNIAEKFLKEKNYPNWTNIKKIIQGTEPGSFTQYFTKWKSFSDKKKPLIRCSSTLSDADWEPRLLHCQIPQGFKKFITEEIEDFKQEDLNEDDIMILDHGLKIFVWIGNGADDHEKAGCDALVANYINNLGRDKNSITVKKILQGEEPEDFKRVFPSWSANLKQKNVRDFL